MKLRFILAVMMMITTAAAKNNLWDNGTLKVSDNQRFLQFTNGKPFFWLGETGWLMPQRLNREEVDFYLTKCEKAGYNVVQIQVINGIPAINTYGQMSFDKDFDFSHADTHGVYGYWNHLDYIINTAARHNIYIGMVCIWGSMVKSGAINEEQAKTYGAFLANRYKKCPNIIWIMGGDIQGDIHPEVWHAMANTIKSIDKKHLMTYHPRGRHTSAQWFNDAKWLDFNTFQSGHRRYGQRMGNTTYAIPDSTEEDNWMYVDSAWNYKPIKPVIDSEPSYEGIPKGLHDNDEPRWSAREVRRYAYWSVFAGSCGHTYGNNNIMQFVKPGFPGAYFADGIDKPWYKAVDDPGFNQMKYLKRLMLMLPYLERTPCQKAVIDNGTRYDRVAATKGNDYLLAYVYNPKPFTLDFTVIKGKKKKVWWMNAEDGTVVLLGTYDNRKTTFSPTSTTGDGVLIATDSEAQYDFSTIADKDANTPANVDRME